MTGYNPLRGARTDFRECRRAHFYNTPMPKYCDEYFKYFQPGANLADDKLTLKLLNDPPPEETDEYKEALQRYEEHLRRADESLTVVDGLYWRKRMMEVIEFCETWGPYTWNKGIHLVKELTACLFAGVLFMTFFGLLLAYIGPLRIKTAGILLVIIIIGSTIIRDSVDAAATSIIGVVLVGFIFFSKISSGYLIEYHRDHDFIQQDGGGGGDADGEYSVVLRVHYWYCGNHSVWINLSKGLIGLE